MDQIIYLIPIAVFLGLVGLGAFLWAMKSGQFDDLEGAAYRVLFDDDDTDEQPDGERDKAATTAEKTAKSPPPPADRT